MLKVLVVEDEELIRKGIVLAIDWASLDCVVVGQAANGEEGLEQAEKCRPGLIITDLKMPKMDGLEMIAQLRARGNDAFVIILTAYDSFAYAQQALRLGAVDFLLKPFHDGDLENAVMQLQNKLSQRRKPPEVRLQEIRSGAKTRYVQEAMDYIGKNCGSSELSVSQVAYALGLSEGHLSHLFKKETGSTVGSYLTRCRIQKAMGLLRQEDRPAMAKGILCGIVAIPLGILAGGLTAGFPAAMVLRNLIPIVLIAALIALGLWRAEKAMVTAFTVFGKIVVAIVTVGLAAAIVESLTGFVLIPGLAPISEGFETVGAIAIVLAGAFPLVYVITRLLKKPLLSLGKLLGINDTAAAGLVATLANSIAAFETVKDMDDRGKVNIAFAVPAAFVFGDHLGFTAGFAPELLGAMIVGKLVGGVAAVGVALALTRQCN